MVNNKIIIDNLMKEMAEIQEGISDENGLQKMEEVKGKLKEYVKRRNNTGFKEPRWIG